MLVSVLGVVDCFSVFRCYSVLKQIHHPKNSLDLIFIVYNARKGISRKKTIQDMG